METTPDLQAQIDRLSQALQQWRDTESHLQPMEQRLSELTERCAEILNRWNDTDERHARAVSEVEGRLSDWDSIETRLQQASSERLRELEGSIEREWQSLRQIHEEPVKQLREQAAALGETCMAAANLALRSFERAEARFAALESDLRQQLAQLSQDVQAMLAEAKRTDRSPTLGSGVAPFPLEGIVRIHDELRESIGASGPSRVASRGVASIAERAPIIHQEPLRQLPEPPALAARLEVLERAMTSGKDEVREAATQRERLHRDWRVGLGLLVIVSLAAAFFGIRLQQRVEERLDSTTARVVAAEQQATTASSGMAATRAEAQRQIVDATQSAVRAQVLANVLAAPDLIRFNLRGGENAPRAYAQILWSRTRGMVLSASQLPPLPFGMVYQAWMMTNTVPASAGTFTPDDAGRATLVIDAPTTVPRPIDGVLVTLEPEGGGSTPSGEAVLRRVPQ